MPDAHASPAKRGLARELLVALGVTSLALALPSALSARLDGEWVLALAMSALAVASYLMSRASNLLAQVFARAVWWQGLAFGIVLAAGHMVGQISGPVVVAIPMYIGGGLLAIAGAGKVGLELESDHFAPVAFRRSLTASMVMAAADTIALLFYAGITIEASRHTHDLINATAFLGAALVMGIAIYGLYRIRVWGLALNILANIAIAALTLCGVFDIPSVIGMGLVATAFAQLLLPIPLLRRMAAKG